LTSWDVAGPFTRTDDDIARRADDPRVSWRPAPHDERGAILTGAVVDYHGPKTVAYLRARVRRAAPEGAVLHLSTVDDLALWVNGRFHWFVPRSEMAWHDFWSNPAHAGRRIPVSLVAGDNQLVVRVRGGVYASGGFFARID
jgi:hypothetical protein